MKHKLIRVGMILAVLLIVSLLIVDIFLGRIVKKGVETCGPIITKVDVKLDGVILSLLSGHATVRGLFVGNPPGYTSESALNIGQASVSLKSMSVFSDKIIIKSINLKSAEITLDGGMRDNNLKKIQSNVNEVSGGASSSKGGSSPSGSKKKIEVDEFVMSGAILRIKSPLLANKMVSIPLPDIRLSDLGVGSEGLDPAELTDKVMNELMKEVLPAFNKALGQASKEAIEAGQGAGQDAKDAAKKASDKLKGLFKR